MGNWIWHLFEDMLVLCSKNLLAFLSSGERVDRARGRLLFLISCVLSVPDNVVPKNNYQMLAAV